MWNNFLGKKELWQAVGECASAGRIRVIFAKVYKSYYNNLRNNKLKQGNELDK